MFNFFKLPFISKFDFSTNLIKFKIWSGVNLDSVQLCDKPNVLQIRKDWNWLIPKIFVKEKKTDLFSNSSVSKIYIIYKL